MMSHMTSDGQIAEYVISIPFGRHGFNAVIDGYGMPPNDDGSVKMVSVWKPTEAEAKKAFPEIRRKFEQLYL